jgi:HEAT repeat protein
MVSARPWYLLGYSSGEGYYRGRPISYWLGRLKRPEVEVRREAIHSLGAIGAAARDAVPELGAILLEDPDRGARIEAALALLKLGPAAEAALPALIQALADHDSVIRMDAALALLRLGRAARPAVPALLRALEDERNETNCSSFSCTIREVVVVALGRASAGTNDAVPALIAVLESASQDSLREATARALGEIGDAAAEAAPLLRALLKGPNEELRQAVQEALHNIERGGKPPRP